MDRSSRRPGASLEAVPQLKPIYSRELSVYSDIQYVYTPEEAHLLHHSTHRL